MRGFDVVQRGATLIGLAIAGSDLVFEVNDAGVVVFALGAAEHLTGFSDEALVGCTWNAVLDEDDAAMMVAVGATVAPGERQGPYRVKLNPVPGSRLTRYAAVSIFRLPRPGADLSCALSLAGAGNGQGGTSGPDLLSCDGLQAVAADLMRQAQQGGLPLKLDLIEFSGFGETMARLPAADADLRRKMVAGVLHAQAAGGGASQIAEGRFAILRDNAAPASQVAEQLKAVAGIAPNIVDIPLDASSPAQALKAMRYALDRYIEEGAQASARGFEVTVSRLVQDAARFRTLLADGAFQLAFQPIVTLSQGHLHHFEALARFNADVSPTDTIRMAEELNLIVDFDLAVVRSVCRHLNAHPHVSIAVNVSGASLLDTRFLALFLAATSADPSVRRRLLVELTETAAVGSLKAAASTLRRLRAAGFRVCIDDFGAGSASLEYLSALEVDIVKFDGRFVRGLERGSRNYILLKHLVGLCKALGAQTVAEMVETSEIAVLIAEVGVEYGQGWYYGMPLTSPNWVAESQAGRAPLLAAR